MTKDKDQEIINYKGQRSPLIKLIRPKGQRSKVIDIRLNKYDQRLENLKIGNDLVNK